MSRSSALDELRGLAPWAILALLVGRFLRLRLSTLAGGPDALLGPLPDDSFYYLEIAARWAAGDGSSFDGIHPTNGYQPLWMWTLVALARVAGDRASFLAVFVPGIVALHAGVAVALFAVQRRALGAAPAVLAAALVLYSPAAHVLSLGMEAGLYVLMLVAAYAALDGLARASASAGVARHAATGALLGLVVLARLEALLLLGLVLAWMAARELRARPVAFAAFALGAVAPAVLYLAGNEIAFGIAMPVSAAIKHANASPRASLLLESVDRIFGETGLVPLLDPMALRDGSAGIALARLHALVLLGALVAWLGRRALDARREGVASLPVALPFALFFLGHLVYVGSGGAAEWPEAWHLVPTILGLCVFPATLLAALPPRIRGGALALASLQLLWIFSPAPSRASLDRHPGALAAEWVEARRPDGDAIGSWDAGYLGWRLERPVVNLDGLVNAPDYLAVALEPGRTLDYLHAEGIELLVNLLPAGELDDGALRGVPLDRLEELARFSAPGIRPWAVFRLLPPTAPARVPAAGTS